MTPKQTSIKVEKACKAIDKRKKGRVHPNENEIIAEECIIHDLSESHIRTILEIPEKRRKSTKYKL